MDNSTTALFFGSFNPIHNGHLQIARYLLEHGYSSEVWFIVTPQNPWKADSTLLAEEQRLALVRAAIAADPRMKASDVEFTMPRPSYTYRTLCALRASHPSRRFALAIGGDNLARFHEWRNAAEILAEFPLLVYPRPGTPLPPLPAGDVTVADAPLADISSTDIRRRVQAGEDITGCVPPCIAPLVRKLYKKGGVPKHTSDL